MKTHFFFVLIAVFGFTACAPRISTIMTKTYSATPDDMPIEIFMDARVVPSNSESLGIIRITDSGFTTQCDSITVVEHLKNEARKAGGNAVVVTEYIRPSVWRSKCHQMAGTILRVSDSDLIAAVTAASDSAQFRNVHVIKPERKLSRMTFAADLGYGWRIGRLNPDLDGFQRSYLKGLMSGWVYDASFNYYFNDYNGLGLIYSAYNAHQNMYAQDLNSGAEGEFKTNDLIYFIGPVYSARLPVADGKCLLNCDLGIGYVSYMSKKRFANELREKVYGATLGQYFKIGIEYKLGENWGLGLQAASPSGVLMSWTVEENGRKELYKADKTGEGLLQIQFLVGVRYYIK